MEGESSFDFDLHQLQGFVSDSIFHFLSDETTPLGQELPFGGSSTPTSTEADLDNLLLACSDSYEATAKRPRLSVPPPAKVRAFAPPKSREEVEQARKNAMPKKTQNDTKYYCVGIWNEWRQHKQLCDGSIIPAVDELDPAALAKLLSHFTLEVRKKNGDEFPPNSLHHIICGIQRHLRMNGKPAIDFFNDSTFADFKMNLDAEMKRLQKKGLGSTKRQAEPLSIEEEELLWSKGLLGSETPQALVDTMLYMNGLYFALRSGEEHRQLRFNPCQIELVERTGQRPFLRYTEDITKNHSGGLKGRKTKPKIVTHYAKLMFPTQKDALYVSSRCTAAFAHLVDQWTPSIFSHSLSQGLTVGSPRSQLVVTHSIAQWHDYVKKLAFQVIEPITRFVLPLRLDFIRQE